MANYYTRIIRIYSKTDFSKINIEEITNTIDQTATMSDLCYYVNNQNKCLDIKFQSKKASGKIALDYNQFDVWEIREDQIFHNEINYSRGVTFGFDEIHFDSTNKILNEAFFKYFMELKAKNQAIERNGSLIIKESGSYHNAIMYDIEFKDSKERIKQVDLETFLDPRGDWSGIEKILNNDNVKGDMDRFNFFVSNPHDPEEFKLYEGFNSIKFLWRGRIVNIEYKSETNWSGKNSDWWDNCLLPEWINFRAKRDSQYVNT